MAFRPRRQSKRIADEMARLEIEEHAKKPCRTLSGGNRRKVELARALLHHPSILMMDEATVGLDPGSRRLLLTYVHELCRDRGMGVLWCTHLVDEAEGADRVLVLNKGKLLTEGTPAELTAASSEVSLADAFLKLTAAPAKKEGGVVRLREFAMTRLWVIAWLVMGLSAAPSGATELADMTIGYLQLKGDPRYQKRVTRARLRGQPWGRPYVGARVALKEAKFQAMVAKVTLKLKRKKGSSAASPHHGYERIVRIGYAFLSH